MTLFSFLQMLYGDNYLHLLFASFVREHSLQLQQGHLAMIVGKEHHRLFHLAHQASVELRQQ